MDINSSLSNEDKGPKATAANMGGVMYASSTASPVVNQSGQWMTTQFTAVSLAHA